MNTLYYILFFAAGIAVDMLYHRGKLRAAQNAYMRGFQHAKREDEKYRDGVYDGINKGVQYRTNEKVAEMPVPKHSKPIIPEHFVDEMHENGQATMQIQ